MIQQLIGIDFRTQEAMTLATHDDEGYLLYLIQEYQSDHFRAAAQHDVNLRIKVSSERGKIYVSSGIESGILRGRCKFVIVPLTRRI